MPVHGHISANGTPQAVSALAAVDERTKFGGPFRNRRRIHRSTRTSKILASSQLLRRSPIAGRGGKLTSRKIANFSGITGKFQHHSGLYLALRSGILSLAITTSLVIREDL
jgi:hypothetical protein